MHDVTVVAIVALVISVYGAILATVVFVHQRRRDRPELALSCHFGYVYRKADCDPEDPEVIPVITIEALNAGVRPVEVRESGFVRADGEPVSPTPYLIEPSPPPDVLTDGGSMRFHYRCDGDVPPGLTVEVRHAFVSGGRGREWRVEPDEWLRPVMVDARWWRG